MKTHIRTKNVPSSKPYLVCGILWAVLAFVFPMYKLSSYLLIAGIDIFAYLAMRKFKVFKDIVIQYEEEIPFENLEVQDVINEGQHYLNRLVQANNKIQNVDVSKDIDDIVKVSQNILNRVQEYPKKVQEIRKFISYYLPTISKMLDYYTELENETFESENVKSSKKKIENMLAQVEKAFKEQLDRLYDDEALDISSDIKVMESLLASQGFVTSGEEK